MALNVLLDLLRRRLGLNPESLSPTLVPAAAGRRMQALGVGDLAAYATLLLGNAAELQALMEELVVAETWFFRGGRLFAELARRLQERTVATQRPVRVLSVPCSTGEEPYSLAISLFEQGVPGRLWSIDAADLSERHLALARAGRFGELSFRQTEPELRARYFRADGRGWELRPDVRATVHFRSGNLVDPLFLSGEPPYDLILCRNLFIYLHADARRQALANLDRLLAADGWLCLGHAEPLEVTEPRFQRLDVEGSFLYQRAQGPAKAKPPLVLPRVPPPPSAKRPTPPAPPPVLLPPPTPVVEADQLPEARRRADAGDLSRALALGEAALRQAGPTADVYSLLGVIHQARHDRAEARRCFEKALYLRPDHEEALTHLMLLLREQGETAQAERLQSRLRRATAGGDA